MPWLRLDDGFAEHPRITACSERARWMHVVALCYCARNLNDGLLDARAVKVVAAIVDKPCKRPLAELVAVGLWIAEGDGCYQIKDFLEWNPDAGTVKKLRRERADAGRRGGLAKAKANATAVASSMVACTPSPPTPPHESSKALGLIDIKEGMKLLVVATGARGQDIDKITKTVYANKCGPAALKLAIEAATGPGVRDPLAVALSELKKRRAA